MLASRPLLLQQSWPLLLQQYRSLLRSFSSPSIPSSPPPLRIASLLPSTTEIVAAIGLASSLVGVTHECDYPASALHGPLVVTSTSLPSPHSLPQAEIHDAIWRSVLAGDSLYGLSGSALAEAAPNVVLTQSLCEVCAVPAGMLPVGATTGDPTVVSLEPTTLEEVLLSIEEVGAACEPLAPGAGARAAALVAGLRDDLGCIGAAVAAVQGARRPRVAFLEWHDPIFTGGHWIPDMLRLAGAEYEMCEPGGRSVPWTPGQIEEYDPDVIVVGPCGFGVQRAVEDTQRLLWGGGQLQRGADGKGGGEGAEGWWQGLRAVQSGEVFAMDANSYCARPGPRLVQGAGIMAGILHGEPLRERLGERLCPADGWAKVLPP